MNLQSVRREEISVSVGSDPCNITIIAVDENSVGVVLCSSRDHAMHALATHCTKSTLERNTQCGRYAFVYLHLRAKICVDIITYQNGC